MLPQTPSPQSRFISAAAICSPAAIMPLGQTLMIPFVYIIIIFSSVLTPSYPGTDSTILLVYFVYFTVQNLEHKDFAVRLRSSVS